MLLLGPPRRVENFFLYVAARVEHRSGSTVRCTYTSPPLRTSIRTRSICLVWPVRPIPLIWSRGNRSFVSQHRSYSSCRVSYSRRVHLSSCLTPWRVFPFRDKRYFQTGYLSPPWCRHGVKNYSRSCHCDFPSNINFFLSFRAIIAAFSWVKREFWGRRKATIKEFWKRKVNPRWLFKIAKWEAYWRFLPSPLFSISLDKLLIQRN